MASRRPGVKELVNVERAHAREMAEMRTRVAVELSLARTDIGGTLAETKAVRSWLGYETVKPFQGIQEIGEALKALEISIREGHGGVGEVCPDGGPKWEEIQAELSRLGTHVGNVSNQLDELRRKMNHLTERIAHTLQAPASPPSPQSENSSTERMEEDIGEMKAM
ncbi:Intraflagellar transport protein 57-like protein [Operophtera brumata]|uniref:Intraflagellar transport protein 57-like protein n=1 Tax=Operophtera brumata TaxID=104452 RepID=A0A0L7L4L5_OPEBR|nr:Intraflagellar transport protein 57-like protein [Operophtera brumata]